MSTELIFVTGANGFLGSHIVHGLLEKGYNVRGTARGSKIELVKRAFARYGSKFEVVNVNDIAVDDITLHLKDVTKVIHAAAPLAGRGDVNHVLKGAIEGSLNIFRQAEKAGIKKIVYTSSIVTVLNSAGSFTDKDWNPITREQALDLDPSEVFKIYVAAKTVAEREVWKFADENKHVDITAVNPPYLYGPLISGTDIPTPDYNALSTTTLIYRLLFPEGKFPDMPMYADVRDVARIHVEALTSPPESSVGRKRLIVVSPHALDFKAAVELIANKRPELKSRLIDAEKAPKFPNHLVVDLKRIEEVTGVKETSYIPVNDTILETVDSLLVQEKGWISRGHTISPPK